MSVAKNKLEDGKYRPGIDDDYDDFDLRSNRGRSQKDGILELLLRSEQSYQQATRRGLKERIEALTVKHREEHASIVAYIDAMQRFDVIFTDIRRKVKDLKKLERVLTQLSAQCGGDAVPDCPILDALSKGS